MSTLDEARALALIERTCALYARCLDDDDLERWPSFFAERCIYKVTTAENERLGMPVGMIYADSRAMLVDRIASLRKANIYEPHSYRHLLGRTLILESTADGTLRTETPFFIARTMQEGETALFATGRYTDRVSIGDSGTVEFTQRIVVCDSPLIDTLLAIPL